VWRSGRRKKTKDNTCARPPRVAAALMSMHATKFEIDFDGPAAGGTTI
jgi:hypothetical protein